MKIKVTNEHILRGMRQAMDLCPIALAVNDLGFQNVEVYNSKIMIDKNLAKLPQEARTFILNYDYDHPVKPFEFEIKLPFWYQVRGALKSIARLNPIKSIARLSR